MENLDLGSVKSFVDTLWVIDCAILVFHHASWLYVYGDRSFKI